MYSKTAGLLIFGLIVVAPLWVASQTASDAQTVPVNLKPVGSPVDGRFRASALPGLEETYLTPEFASSHAANLLLLKSGDLLCVWFSGSREGDSNVGIMMARLPKGSNQWSEPQRIDHHPGESYQNPVVFQAPNGALWLIHTTQPAGQGQANARVLLTKSADDGKTWTTPAVLFDQPGAFVRQPLVTMSNGDWMLPMYFTPSKGITNGAETNYSVVKISGDQGAHWKDCAIPESNGYVQPSVVRPQDGRYLAFFRSRYADYIYKSASSDGCTWTVPQKTQLPNNNSSIQVAKLTNGHLVIAFNNVRAVVTKGKPQTGPRKPLSVALSEDGGETWGWVRDLETGIPRAGELLPDPIKTEKPGREEYSYPSILQAADGKINVAYTYRRLTIKIVRFDESWLKTGTTTGTFTGDSTK
jgi:predicted neuraminidase